MIDFVKIVFDKSYKEEMRSLLLSNEFLDFIKTLHLTTGVIDDSTRGKFNNLDILIYPQREIQIKNSLHSLYNSIKTSENINYNDFTLSNIKEVLKSLENAFGKEYLQHTYLTQLEFGFNIELPIKATDFVWEYILTYKNNQHNYSMSDRKGYIKKFGIVNLI
ncbi:hypothetical protein Barb6_02764 [Bacteroidales bacterium Barb6]|nr:hypothetical protein Barb6_02764 [Bacteroidales bacterium Barb6]